MPLVLRSVSMPRLRTSTFVLLWAEAAIHILTIYMALKVSGWLAASLSALFPIAAQVYWIVDLWQTTGAFWHFLTIACAAYLGLAFVLSLMRPGNKTIP